MIFEEHVELHMLRSFFVSSVGLWAIKRLQIMVIPDKLEREWKPSCNYVSDLIQQNVVNDRSCTDPD
jgi:hypothetical protein